MLSRSAQGLYWMGRYIERAIHACRLLETQVSTLIDRPLEEIHSGWELVHHSLKCAPPGGLLREQCDDFTLADSFTLAGNLTFEQSNDVSIRTSLELGRENARQMRHCISEELWLSLNHEFLDFKSKEMPEIWSSAPENFYRNTEQQLSQVFSLADSTMYRDAPWHFIRLGRSIEGIQLGAALLLGHMVVAGRHPESANGQMRQVLSVFNAGEIHLRVHGHSIDQETVLGMLVQDRLLPSSLLNHADEIDRCLTGVGPGHAKDCDSVYRLSRQLIRLASGDLPASRTKAEALSSIEPEARNLNGEIDRCYFTHDSS